MTYKMAKFLSFKLIKGLAFIGEISINIIIDYIKEHDQMGHLEKWACV